MNIWYLKDKIDKLREFSFIKTIFINFYCLPIKQALFFLIYVASNVRFKGLSGEISITSPINRGMLQIGFYGRHIFSSKSYGLLIIKGRLIINGNGIKLGMK